MDGRLKIPHSIKVGGDFGQLPRSRPTYATAARSPLSIEPLNCNAVAHAVMMPVIIVDFV